MDDNTTELRLVQSVHVDDPPRSVPELKALFDAPYWFRDPPRVQQYLHSHPQLEEVLIDAWPHLRRHFGPDVQVFLEVVSDPEIETWDQLIAHVRTAHQPEEALYRLDQFDDEWFLDQLSRVSGQMNFNLEFA